MPRSLTVLAVALAMTLCAPARSQESTVRARGASINSPWAVETDVMVLAGRVPTAKLREALEAPAQRGAEAQVDEADLYARQQIVYGGGSVAEYSAQKAPTVATKEAPRRRRPPVPVSDPQTSTALGTSALALGGLAGLFLWMRSRRLTAAR